MRNRRGCPHAGTHRVRTLVRIRDRGPGRQIHFGCQENLTCVSGASRNRRPVARDFVFGQQGYSLARGTSQPVRLSARRSKRKTARWATYSEPCPETKGIHLVKSGATVSHAS